MSVKKKPLVVVTRKLPDSIETRMRELFDARLNLDDTPMTPEQIAEAVRTADVLVPTVTDEITEAASQGPRLQGAADRQFRQRRRQYRRDRGPCARHHRDQHPESPDRRHRRHDHGADPGGAAAADRRRLHPHRGQELAGLVADLDARPSHRRQAPRHHRHGPDRPGRGAPGARLRPADPLSQPPPGRAGDRRRIGRDLLGKPRPDAGADGHHLGELSAHAGDVPSVVGAAAEADPQGRLYRQHRARRGDRRRHPDQAARNRRDRRRRPRRVRERAGGQPETGAARQGRQGRRCCRIWARPPSRAASRWARR